MMIGVEILRKGVEMPTATLTSGEIGHHHHQPGLTNSHSGEVRQTRGDNRLALLCWQKLIGDTRLALLC